MQNLHYLSVQEKFSMPCVPLSMLSSPGTIGCYSIHFLFKGVGMADVLIKLMCEVVFSHKKSFIINIGIVSNLRNSACLL